MSVNVVKLSNIELLQLSQELQAFLGEKISLLVRYKLNQIIDKISPILKPYLEIRNKEITALAPEGNLPQWLDMGTPEQRLNPLHEQFVEKMKDIDKDISEIPWKKVDFSLIQGIESTSRYTQIYKFFTDPE